MKNKIKNIFDNYKEKTYFSYAKLTEGQLKSIEQSLQIKIPDDFLWFIESYGSGGMEGIYIFGVTKTGQIQFVDETREYRKYGLPNKFLVVQNCDEWIDCIDTNNGAVVKWDQGSGVSEIEYNSFCEYLLDELERVIEDME